MRKLLLVTCSVLVLSAGSTFAQTITPGTGQAFYNGSGGSAQASNNGVSANAFNGTTTLGSASATATASLTNTFNINAALKDSVVGGGTLAQTTTNTRMNTTTASGGTGSSFNTASLTRNEIRQTGSSLSAYNGSVSMTDSMAGQGILQANLNTAPNAVQQNSVALTSTVGGNGGGLSGFNLTPCACTLPVP